MPWSVPREELSIEQQPEYHEYIIAVRCPSCKADPWTPCDAPARIRSYNKRPKAYVPWHVYHVARQSIGGRIHSKDSALVANHRYDGDHETENCRRCAEIQSIIRGHTRKGAVE